jgi:hypothetical protein
MGAGLCRVGLRRIFLNHGLRVASSLEHVAFAINPSVSNVLDDECGEQASDQDGSCSSLIFNALYAVIGEEELCVCEELHLVSFSFHNGQARGTYMHDGSRNDDARAKLAHGYN